MRKRNIDDPLSKFDSASPPKSAGEALEQIDSIDDKQEKKKSLDLAVSLFPENQNLLRFATGYYDNVFEDLATARKLRLKLLEMNPDDLKSLKSLGSLYLRDGDITNARDCVEKALRITPTHKDIKYLLSKIEFADGNIRKGRQIIIDLIQQSKGINPMYLRLLALHISADDRIWEVLRLSLGPEAVEQALEAGKRGGSSKRNISYRKRLRQKAETRLKTQVIQKRHQEKKIGEGLYPHAGWKQDRDMKPIDRQAREGITGLPNKKEEE